ncbi:hypothetical protein P9112_009054 [Eukaryota sp. TZLM1-RC]
MSKSDSLGMMNGAFFVSRTEILEWINTLFNTNVQKIEELGNGVVYCQIMHLLYPDLVNLSKVNFNAILEHDNLRNLKYLQSIFRKAGIKRDIDLARLSTKNYMCNLETIQWFKSFFDSKSNSDGIPVEKLNQTNQGQRQRRPSMLPRRTAPRRSTSNPSFSSQDTNRTTVDEAQLTALQKQVDVLQKERNFYFKKLLMIEQLSQNNDNVPVDELKVLLYATNLDSPLNPSVNEIQ